MMTTMKFLLIAYLATMPLLLAIMIVERGLTRLLGVGHLITWTPLVVYLSGRLWSDAFVAGDTQSAWSEVIAALIRHPAMGIY